MRTIIPLFLALLVISVFVLVSRCPPEGFLSFGTSKVNLVPITTGIPYMNTTGSVINIPDSMTWADNKYRPFNLYPDFAKKEDPNTKYSDLYISKARNKIDAFTPHINTISTDALKLKKESKHIFD